MKIGLFGLLLTLLPVTFLQAGVVKWAGDPETVAHDLRLIQQEAGWKRSLRVSFNGVAGKNLATIVCSASDLSISVRAPEQERIATLYHAIHQLGFLFPHPRWQVSPSEASAATQCGKTFEWRPAFSHRGFHLHTLHPNEWVHGFFMGEASIAEDTIRWLARNRQNSVDVRLLRKNWKLQMDSLKSPFELAKRLGISRGINNGPALQQQNSWKMIPLARAITGKGDEAALLRGLRKLQREIDYDFITMEFGTSEFTAVNYERALSWMALAQKELQAQNKFLFSSIHVSTNQVSPKWGNFNFLAQHADPEIGIWPHTVMFYGLYDESVPMYGNENFHHLLEFIRQEKNRREVWYFPETSYWIAMDVDVPLYLTDYLSTRALDMRNLHHEGISGHVTFTSGQELGYWLFDWAVALNVDLENDFDHLAGLRLLGEDEELWRKILVFQTKHFKEQQLISVLSFPNLQDEIARGHRIHERSILRELARSAPLRESEILRLEAAIEELPELTEIKHDELRWALEITELRLHHALAVRKALRFPRPSEGRSLSLAEARGFRLAAQERMDQIRGKFNRYPEAKLFERHSNPTSYQYGYLWPAAELRFWDREEAMVRMGHYCPFFRNIYNVFDIIF